MYPNINQHLIITYQSFCYKDLLSQKLVYFSELECSENIPLMYYIAEVLFRRSNAM